MCNQLTKKICEQTLVSDAIHLKISYNLSTAKINPRNRVLDSNYQFVKSNTIIASGW